MAVGGDGGRKAATSETNIMDTQRLAVSGLAEAHVHGPSVYVRIGHKVGSGSTSGMPASEVESEIDDALAESLFVLEIGMGAGVGGSTPR